MIPERYVGRLNAPLVIVGDAPTRWEFDNDEILPNRIRGLLLDMLEGSGFNPDNLLYIPCYSQAKMSGGTEKLTGPQLQEDAKAHLIPVLKSHNRRLIIGLGNNALCAIGVMEKPEGVNSKRSRRLTSPFIDGVEIAASIHPRIVLDKPDENSDDFYCDLVFAKRLWDGDFEDQAPMVVEDLETPESINVLIKEADAYPYVSYDLESTGLDRHKDLVVSFGFANGRKIGHDYLARFWAGFDKLRPRFEEHVLSQFGEAFAELFSRSGKDYDLISHGGTKFDDPLVQTNLGVTLPGTIYNTQFLKWALNKQGGYNGLKENVTRYCGYADYDALIDERVKEASARRGKKMLRSEPKNAEDFYVLDWAGVKPIEGRFIKKLGEHSYSWPTEDAVMKANLVTPGRYAESLDKKYALWAMLDYPELRIYQARDALYTWILGVEKFMPMLDKDPVLWQSAEFRHVVGRLLARAEMRGMLMDVEKNRELSEQYRVMLESSKKQIDEQVARICPEIEDFNPNSGPQLRKVLFGDALIVPHIDARRMCDYWDRRSVEATLSQFHQHFYGDYSELKELALAGAYSAEATEIALKQTFIEWMGKFTLSLGRGDDEAVVMAEVTFDKVPPKRDQTKVYARIEHRKVYPFGIYQPDPQAVTKGGDPSVKAVVLQALHKQKEEPLLPLIIMHNKATKLRGTFVDGIFKKIDENYVLHGEYNCTLKGSARVSSSAPNMQNMVAFLRGQLIARPGMTITGFDLSGAEARTVAALSGDTDMMEAIYSADFHTTTAMMVTGLSADEITPVLRKQFKVLNFMLIFGGSSFALAIMLGISVDEADSLIERYFARFQKLCAWMENQKKIAGQPPYFVESVFGSRLYTHNMLSGDHKIRGHTERTALNFPVQSTSGELTFWYIDKIMQRWAGQVDRVEDQIFLLNSTHDSGSFENDPQFSWMEDTDKRDKDGKIIQRPVGPLVETIRQVIDREKVPFPPLDTVDFKCDIEVGPYWYGQTNAMKALDGDYGTAKQSLPWHLITGVGSDEEEREEIEEMQEMEEVYYAERAA